MTRFMPTISIITPVFNGAATILDCLKSIDSQTYPPFEHIIINGNSTDTTPALINTRKRPYRTVITEPDRGLYDAMNKGIKKATGDIVGILNADDFYPADDILSTVANALKNIEIDSCYGDLLYVDSKDTEKTIRNWKSGKYARRKFFSGWMVPHPTFFVRRSIYEELGYFNLELGSAADYEIMIRFLVKHRITTTYLNKIIVKMRIGGASNKSISGRLKANRMDRKAWAVNGIKPYPWTVFLKPIRKIGQWVIK